MNNSKSIIHTAGGSALGRMMTKIFSINEIEIINTVRREKHIEELKQIGGKYTVLSNNYEDLRKELKIISDQLRPNLAFECVGGEMTGIILASIKENGLLYHYGNLSLKSISNVLTRDLLFKNKTMKGFWVANYLKTLPEEELNTIMQNVINYKTSTDYFDVNVAAVYKPSEVEVAIKNYRNDMGKGKIILDFTK